VLNHDAPVPAAPRFPARLRLGALALALSLTIGLGSSLPAGAAGLPPPKPAPGSPGAGSGSPESDERFVWPAHGVITTRFGEVGPYSPRGHAGLDIAAPSGTPIYAAAGERVVLAAMTGGGYGIQVLIEHPDGTETRYAHLSEARVGAGERVRGGELIGRMGSTGYSTGPHLHFEVIRDGAVRDPLRFLP
jgi:murein DD-endopeptidase MepM/ murein hydrolase activator NlpD